MTDRELTELLGRLFANLGFPAFIAVYLLVKVSPALDRLTAAVTTLTVALAEVLKRATPGSADD